MYGQESAETLALRVLGWLAGDPDRIGAFLEATGISRGELAGLAAEPVFLAAVIDHCLESDERVIACCDALGLPYEALGGARTGLPGGRDPHWT